MKTPQIYPDNASTTPLDPAVLETMLPYLVVSFITGEKIRETF